MTEQNDLDLPRQNYMDNSEFNSNHYYFHQIDRPEAFEHILEIILQRRSSNYTESQYKILRNNSLAIATISKFNGSRFLGQRDYAFIEGKIEMICVNDFERPELSHLLDGPFNTFQDLKSAYNEFLEKLEIENFIEFCKDTIEEHDNEPELIKENKSIIDESEDIDLQSSKGEFGSYGLYRLDKDEIPYHLDRIQSGIAKMLDIAESEVYMFIDSKIIYYIQRYRFDASESKMLGERYFARVGDKWMMIYNYNFGEPEISQSINGPFDTEENLLSELTYFINSIGFDEPEYYEGSLSNYSGSYAHEIEGLSDDFIDDALGGDPEAYWNID